ncbi:hypothetical protein NL676_007129 [Syzygium grande]|nr:hypothetical protein NL676_007129 [Syzygium grande]
MADPSEHRRVRPNAARRPGKRRLGRNVEKLMRAMKMADFRLHRALNTVETHTRQSLKQWRGLTQRPSGGTSRTADAGSREPG